MNQKESTGAQVLVSALLAGGVDTCFANPGTSEMHFVAALDRAPEMRCVLGLFEGVVTGAADGYFRMANRPAATLLHLGPGLANGLANLHNAKKAHSGIVNIVGDHATQHLALDAPLTSDIEGLARPMSHFVKTLKKPEDIRPDCAEAIRRSSGRPGEISTLILPADIAWSSVNGGAEPEAEKAARITVGSVSESQVQSAARAIREGASTLILLGSFALQGRAADYAGQLSEATGCTVMSEFYGPRISRGAGRIPLRRLPYAVDAAVEVLRSFRRIVLVGAKTPVAFFAYPGKPGLLAQPGTEIVELCGVGDDAEHALAWVCDVLGATKPAVRRCGLPAQADLSGPLAPEGIGAVLAAVMPEEAIVVDEAVTSGRGFDAATMDANPHDWLTGCGGSIGFALPVAIGAAIACPDRRVIALEGDGSGMYTMQSLWTMVREALDITVVIFANRAYRILQGEFRNVGAGKPGKHASEMLSLENPTLDWTALARGMGMTASRATTLAEFDGSMRHSIRTPGPHLIEVIL